MHHATRFFIAASLALGVVAAVFADDDDEGRFYTASHPAWKTECGGCHVAYPPQLLPARSWRVLMSDLENHFGTDASLDLQTAADIGAFLESHAGRDRAPTAAPVLRITETPWFLNEHDEVPARAWQSAKVASRSNCTACHVKADQGSYGENTLFIPK
jgi:Dihaem cytochrome c